MIVVKLTGGLGNQLFQYAAGRNLALRHGVELLLEDSFYECPPSKATPRTYELGHFHVVARRTNMKERQGLRSYTRPMMKHLRRCLPLPGNLRYVHETMSQLENVLNVGDNIFMDGYWQSEQYFSGIETLLHRELVPLRPMSVHDQAIAQRMAMTSAVNIHVRRGDYLSNPSARSMHGVCGLDYYQKAMAYIAKHLDKPVFFIFSDDPAWVAINIKSTHPVILVDHNGPAQAFQDLRLMSLCRYHIIANSSFSWWGAWLNTAPDKIVIRPKAWFKGNNNSDSSICPSSWLKI